MNAPQRCVPVEVVEPDVAWRATYAAIAAVADSADEASYVPDLEAAGWVLRIREPAFEEHRLLRLEVPECNLHPACLHDPRPRG